MPSISSIEALVVRLPRDFGKFVGTAGTPVPRRSDVWGSEYFKPDYLDLYYSPFIESLVVRLETNDGVVGWGEGQVPIGAEVAAACVRLLLGPIVHGRDPLDSDRLWTEMYECNRGRGQTYGYFLDALSAIDNALWDLKGKILHQPVYRLLGGAHRERVPVYLSGLQGVSRDEQVQSASDAFQKGYHAFKLFLGRGYESDRRLVGAVREAIGADDILAVDGIWKYDLPGAVRLGHDLDELGCFFFEAPLPDDYVDEYARLSASVRVAVATGEALRSRAAILPFLRRDALGLVQPDIGRCGLTEGRKIAALAESFGVAIAPHVAIGGPIYLAQALHYAVSIPNLAIVEYNPLVADLASMLSATRFSLVEGALPLLSGDGLGVALDETELRRHAAVAWSSGQV